MNPLILKLEHGADLSDEDRAALTAAIGDVRQFGPHEDMIREGDRPDNVHVVLEGFAFRYKSLPDGQRQIMAYLVPGDLCDLHVAILGEMDHSIGAAGPCRVAYIPRETIEALTEKRPCVARALWWATLVDEGILREWLVGMGRREADRRMAHLFCELLVRLRSVGLADGGSFDFPVTQADLADTLGLSAVHANRTLQELRGKGLIGLKGKRLSVRDVEGLKAFAGFDANYLHLTKRRGAAAAGAGGSGGLRAKL